MRTVRIAGVMVVLLGALFVGQIARAHAAYKSSDPADGARVGSPPGRVTAEFTEPLAGGSYLRITDPCGTRVDNGDVSISGFTMSVSMDGSAAGRYVVFFRAHSQLDPHVTQGEFEFTATSGERCAAEVEPGDPATGGDDPASSDAATGSGEGGRSEADVADAAARRSGGDGGDAPVASSARARDRQRDVPRARVANIAAPADDQGEEGKRVWDGIRLEPFLTGLLLAAIIGAAGGKIYAGIMGPRA